jgi:hypothetical protein
MAHEHLRNLDLCPANGPLMTIIWVHGQQGRIASDLTIRSELAFTPQQGVHRTGFCSVVRVNLSVCHSGYGLDYFGLTSSHRAVRRSPATRLGADLSLRRLPCQLAEQAGRTAP